MGRELAAWCRRRYRTASGSFDTYVPFIERAIGLLAADGTRSFPRASIVAQRAAETTWTFAPTYSPWA